MTNRAGLVLRGWVSACAAWFREPAPVPAGVRRLRPWQAWAIVAVVAAVVLAKPTIGAIRAMGSPPPVAPTWSAARGDIAWQVGLLLAAVGVFAGLVWWLRGGWAAAGLPRHAAADPGQYTYWSGLGVMFAAALLTTLTSGMAGVGTISGWPGLTSQGVGIACSAVIEELVVVATPVLVLGRARVPRWGIVAVAMLLRGPYHLYHGPWAIVWAAVWSGGLTLLFLAWGRLLALIAAHFAWDLLVLGASVDVGAHEFALQVALLVVAGGALVLWRVLEYRHRRWTRQSRPATSSPVLR